MKKIILIMLLVVGFAYAGEVENKENGKVENKENGKELYLACGACHGAKGERKAFGLSLVIKDMTKKEFRDAMVGYRDGSYGGNMKGLMKGQSKNIDDKGIVVITNYLSLRGKDLK